MKSEHGTGSAVPRLLSWLERAFPTRVKDRDLDQAREMRVKRSVAPDCFPRG